MKDRIVIKVLVRIRQKIINSCWDLVFEQFKVNGTQARLHGDHRIDQLTWFWRAHRVHAV